MPAARGGFQSYVLLPNNCPVGTVAGLPQPRKALAVASACLEAVKALHKARPLATQACMTLTQLMDARRSHMAISSAECIFTFRTLIKLLTKDHIFNYCHAHLR